MIGRLLTRSLLAFLALTTPVAAQDYFLLPEGSRAAETTTVDLLVAGSIMSVVGYFGHITIHESMHVAGAKYYGARILDFKVLPTKEDGEWHLGFAEYQYKAGTMDDKDHALVSLLPHYVNLGAMALFEVAHHGGFLPDNKYAKLSLSLVALGAALDTGMDAVLYRRSSDLYDGLRLAGYSKVERAAIRIGVAAVCLHTILSVCEALYEVFFESSPSNDSPEGLYAKAGPDHIELGLRIRF